MKQVYGHVIERGFPWIQRAFVVDDWYITAYEPIKDIHGQIVGMLYVGILESKYGDIKNSSPFPPLFHDTHVNGPCRVIYSFAEVLEKERGRSSHERISLD